ncbi:MAG: hypothetical protein TREMPRED_002077 [Tremellales sp. Tagirdzhanova-0007]|nr:MAG: hypothetical protein TREMPRED_002077 [Tremellales sp. Tagirdzhanova-0007]
MSVSNPSHLLISRNPPRSLAHPQLAPTSTSRHAASSVLSPTGILGPWNQSTEEITTRPPKSLYHVVEDLVDHIQDEIQDEEVEIHPTFSRNASWAGRVKVVVGRHEFWCHKDILWFASPFFQGLLQGSWAETAQITPSSCLSSPTDTDPVIPSLSLVPETVSLACSDENENGNETDDSKRASIYLEANEDEPNVADILRELREIPNVGVPSRPLNTPSDEALGEIQSPRSPLPILLQLQTCQPLPPTITTTVPSQRRSGIRHSFSSMTGPNRRDGLAEAVVELHEESASAFQDFLFWAYPHLECKVSWTNVENLLALSAKLIVPALQKLCDHFLLTHASGRPVMALMLAEQHANCELYRESSRFVLDQPTWDQEEMDCLSEQTQLKLSKRRNWFLERLLKLGSIDVKKEYTCRPDCPDSSRCQAQLDEKWRQAHSAICRLGPPQPSVAFRCLRQLETFSTNPSLVMPHPLCQSAAKSWVVTLFDRMFQPKMVFTLNPGTEKVILVMDIDELMGESMEKGLMKEDVLER